MTAQKLDLTVLVAAKNEEVNLPKCLEALKPAKRVVVVDSHSIDRTAEFAVEAGVEVLQFDYQGGYPRKRQWALDTLRFDTAWILLLDADEVVPDALWAEIENVLSADDAPDAFLIRKGFHFQGRRFRYGGFSHAAVLLFRKGKARFEDLDLDVAEGLDMEIHERVIVEGQINAISTPLIHEDFKGIDAYLERHRRYAEWEAALRRRYRELGTYGRDTVPARLFGNTQERRRFLKKCILRIPGEPFLWFGYHYFLRMGFLEGRAGFNACRIRMEYIRRVRDLLAGREPQTLEDTR